MKLEVIKNAVTSKAARQVLIAKKNSPTIMFGAGVVGVVATTILACRATMKMDELLEEVEDAKNLVNQLEHPKYSDKDRKHDLSILQVKMVVNIGKLYAPAVGLGILSIGALTGSHVALRRRNVALMAAYSAVEKGFKEYRQRVSDEFGAEKEEEIRYGVSTKNVTIHDTETGKDHTLQIKSVGDASIYARIFDEYSTSWSKEPSYNQLFISCQQNYANDLLRARGHVFLNEIYDMLGLERTKAGCIVGWVRGHDNGDNYIDFGVFNGNEWNALRFVNGDERSILLDFNVDGVIYDKI